MTDHPHSSISRRLKRANSPDSMQTAGLLLQTDRNGLALSASTRRHLQGMLQDVRTAYANNSAVAIDDGRRNVSTSHRALSQGKARSICGSEPSIRPDRSSKAEDLRRDRPAIS
jgi:hypothetical protein